MTRGFLSDNASGAHPAVLAALAAANEGHVPSYGADPWTAELEEVVRDLFGPDAAVFPVFNGTGANVTAVRALLRPWESAVAVRTSHMVTDESTAPELVGGAAFVVVDDVAGKLTPATAQRPFAAYDGTVHHARPAALTLTQATELGTVYRPAELADLVALARRHDARVHVDGARLANAAVRLGASLAEAAAGADVVSLGATKNGTLFGDAIVVLDPALAEPVARLRKATTQLASKMRFASAQLLALLRDGLWAANAARANAAADHLAARLGQTLGLAPVHPVEANAVFVPVPPARMADVLAAAPVLPWDAGTVRAVASFDTTEEDVEALVAALGRVLG